jgi:hypothetical protein
MSMPAASITWAAERRLAPAGIENIAGVPRIGNGRAVNQLAPMIAATNARITASRTNLNVRTMS